jgi:hypothetical protein
MLQYIDLVSPLDPYNVLSGLPTELDKAYAYTVGSTYLLSSTTVNAFRLSYSKTRQDSASQQTFDAAEMGSKVFIAPSMKKVMSIAITSGFTMSSNPRRLRSNLYQLSDDVSMTRGKHQFGFGGRVAQARTIGETGGTILPNFTISGDVTGTGLSDFLLGKVTNLVQGNGNGNYLRMKYISLSSGYGQMTPRLTVSGSFRWAPIPAGGLQRPVPNVSNFSLERYRQGIRSKVFPNAPRALSILRSGTGAVQQWRDPKSRERICGIPIEDFAPRVVSRWMWRNGPLQFVLALA